MKNHFILTISLILFLKISFAQTYLAYTPATSMSTNISTATFNTNYTTGCDMLDYKNNFKGYVWAGSAGSGDIAHFAYQVNNGPVTVLDLQDKEGIRPDIAFVHRSDLNNVLYAVVAYLSRNNEPQWEAYRWTGSSFVYHIGSHQKLTTGFWLPTTIKVDGCRSGNLIIAWDNNKEINYTGGNVDVLSNLWIDAVNTRKIGGINFIEYPDVAITDDPIDTRFSQVFFSCAWGFPTSNTVFGFNYNFNDIYDLGSRSNLPAVNHTVLNTFFSNANSTQVGKTSISATERHAFHYKWQAAIAWEEMNGSDNYIQSAMSYITGPGSTTQDILDQTVMDNLYVQNSNNAPAIVNCYSEDVIVTGWNFKSAGLGTSPNVPLSQEVLARKMTYDIAKNYPNLNGFPDAYLGIGEPGLGIDPDYPTDVLKALAMAGKQSRNVLYFFYDDTQQILFAKESSPSTIPLRKQLSADDAQFSISPNPASNYCMIADPSVTNGILEIFNLDGQKVFSTEFQEEFELKTSNFPAGAYMLVIKDSGNVKRSRLIIQ